MSKENNGAVVFLFGLPFDVSNNEITNLISKYGEVFGIKLVKDSQKFNRGAAYIYFKHRSDADFFVHSIDGCVFRNCSIGAHLKPNITIKEKDFEPPAHPYLRLTKSIHMTPELIKFGNLLDEVRRNLVEDRIELLRKKSRH